MTVDVKILSSYHFTFSNTHSFHNGVLSSVAGLVDVLVSISIWMVKGSCEFVIVNI